MMVYQRHQGYWSTLANQKVSFLAFASQKPKAPKVGDDIEWVMRSLTLSLRGVRTNKGIFHTIPNLHRRRHVLDMADQETQKQKDELTEEKKTDKAKELPPPPEKPLPGDCCGSGCVRCVWDIYYEELEEYNNLLKNDVQSKP